MANTNIYAILISNKAQSLKARIGSVGPLRPGSAALDEDLP